LRGALAGENLRSSALRRQPCNVALLDRSLHGEDSLHLFARLKGIRPELRVIVLSGRADPQTVGESLAARHSRHGA
jgi:DNA-binding NarL/FixJ family response regulator